MNTITSTAVAQSTRKFPQGNVFVDGKFIMEVVSEYYKVSVSDVIFGKRVRKIIVPRQIMMYLMVKHTKLTLKDIGGHFKADSYFEKKRKCKFKDHTTVIHSCESVKNLMDSDDSYYYDVKQLTEKITSMHVKIKTEEKLEEVAKNAIHLLLNLRNAENIYNDHPCFQSRTSLRRWQEMSDAFLKDVSSSEEVKMVEAQA